jgi:hypothetical protein
MSDIADPVLKALKTFVVVAGVAIVLGTATLIWLLVKRGGQGARPPAAAVREEPANVALPRGAEVIQVAVSGSQLLLLGRVPSEGQFVAVVDLASGERRRLLRLVPEATP